MSVSRKKLVDEFMVLRDQKAQLKSDLKQVQESLDICEHELVMQMENEGLQSFKDNVHGTVFLRGEVRSSIENQAALFAWLKNNKMGDIIKRTVHHMTLGAIAREHFEKNDEQIPGLNANFITKLGVKRSPK